jgi:hypothetical protein
MLPRLGIWLSVFDTSCTPRLMLTAAPLAALPMLAYLRPSESSGHHLMLSAKQTQLAEWTALLTAER